MAEFGKVFTCVRPVVTVDPSLGADDRVHMSEEPWRLLVSQLCALAKPDVITRQQRQPQRLNIMSVQCHSE